MLVDYFWLISVGNMQIKHVCKIVMKLTAFSVVYILTKIGIVWEKEDMEYNVC